MMYLNNYYTNFMFLVAKVCLTYSSTILSRIIFNFPLVFKISQYQIVEILCLQALIMKFIHVFKQNGWYLENKKEIENYERQNYAHHDQ